MRDAQAAAARMLAISAIAYQKSKRRGDLTPAEKQTIADALDRETTEEYRKRVRMIEAQMEKVIATIERMGWTVQL